MKLTKPQLHQIIKEELQKLLEIKPRVEEDNPGAYYARRRAEAQQALKALEDAQAEGAPSEELARLERELELARYTGD